MARSTTVDVVWFGLGMRTAEIQSEEAVSEWVLQLARQLDDADVEKDEPRVDYD